MRLQAALTTLIPALALAFLAACGAPESTTAETADTEDSISTRTEAYVTVQRDLRRCASPVCGGYFITEINRTTATKYVSRLDLTAIDDATAEKILNAPDGELLLKGKLGPTERVHSTKPLIVSEAYRGLPGVTPAATDAHYAVPAQDPPITCIAAPCNNSMAKKLNSRAADKSVTRVSLDMIGAFVDRDWLLGRIDHHDALVTGQIMRGDPVGSGHETIVQASQVYIRLPDSAGPCLRLPTAPCASGEVKTYSRDENRCLLETGCVTPGVCPFALPTCTEGYTESSWARAPHGCATVVCDPSFVY